MISNEMILLDERVVPTIYRLNLRGPVLHVRTVCNPQGFYMLSQESHEFQSKIPAAPIGLCSGKLHIA